MRTRLYKLLPLTLLKMQDSVITLKSHFWKHSILTTKTKKQPRTHKMVNTYRSLTFVQFLVVFPLCRRSIEILNVSRDLVHRQCQKKKWRLSPTLAPRPFYAYDVIVDVNE